MATSLKVLSAFRNHCRAGLRLADSSSLRWDRTDFSTTVAYRPFTALTHHILWLSSALSAKCAVLIHYATVVLGGVANSVPGSHQPPATAQRRDGEGSACRALAVQTGR